jgi:KaiC/GvpD/RAD55 family RecA-like ATPase
MPTSTGDAVLDEVLCGGYPENRSVLVTGGPGTGKSTLGMQFVQQGLADGERCVYLSTEQTLPELHDSFENFAFDLDHERLSVASIHAVPGQTIEGDDAELTLDTLGEDEEGLGENFAAPFTRQYVQEYLRKFEPCDRIVLDSVSGLRPIAANMRVFRRAVLDLIQLFSQEFTATSLLVSEETQGSDAGDNQQLQGNDTLRYNTHGVIRLWRESVRGDLQRFLRVHKMRGVDHDTRDFVIEISKEGINIVPRFRSPGSRLVDSGHLSTGILGLDQLLNGGLLKGSVTLVEHDGKANLTTITNSVLSQAIDDDWSISFTPPTDINPDQLWRLFEERLGSVDELLKDDRLFIQDPTNTFDDSVLNVYTYDDNSGRGQSVGAMDLMSDISAIDDARGDDPMLYVINTKSLLKILDAEEIKTLRQWTLVNAVDPEDAIVYIHNPSLLPGTLGEYFVDEAMQVLETWLHRGMQFLVLKKAPTNNIGRTRYVEYIQSSPYVKIQESNR